MPCAARASATQSNTNATIGGSAISHERVGATFAPFVGTTSDRNNDTPIASTTAAVHPPRPTGRLLMSTPRNSDISNEVARIGSTSTSVPVPIASASNT